MNTTDQTNQTDPDDRIEIMEDPMGASVYLLNAAGTIRIAECGLWMNTTLATGADDPGKGWIFDDQHDDDFFVDRAEWLNEATRFAHRLIAMED